MTQPRRHNAARIRLFIAIGLGMISIGGGLLLATADAMRGSVYWDHHSPISAAPLFLIAGAIAAVSIGRPPQGRQALQRLVAVLAFTAWGTAQLTPDPAAAGAFNDVAILLFVIDGGVVVVTEARAMLAHHRQTAQPTPTHHRLARAGRADPHGVIDTCCNGRRSSGSDRGAPLPIGPPDFRATSVLEARALRSSDVVTGRWAQTGCRVGWPRSAVGASDKPRPAEAAPLPWPAVWSFPG
ncbi:MAG TPA: hypothetical protein VIX86_10350 [Streptosporangiaceae bacterium]